MLTEEQVNKAMSEIMPDVIAGMKEKLIKSIQYSAEQTACNLVREAISEWVLAEMIPEVKKELVSGKESILLITKKVAENTTAHLIKSIDTELKRKLESAYERSKIFEALFK